jgi:hypothetical protein
MCTWKEQRLHACWPHVAVQQAAAAPHKPCADHELMQTLPQ